MALSAAANAADMYRPTEGGYKDGPAYAGVNWSGLYAGVNGGYAFGNNSQDVKVSGPTGTLGSPAWPELTGGFGGGQIGYNWQGVLAPRVVLGVEADIQGAGLSKGATGTDVEFRRRDSRI